MRLVGALLLAGCVNETELYKLEPELCVDPDAIWFGEVPGGESATRWFTVSNCGQGELDVDDIRLSSEGGAFTLLESAPDEPLGPSDMWEVPVVYEPESDEDLATAWVETADGGEMKSVDLMGWKQPLGVTVPAMDDSPVAYVEVPEGETRQVTLRFTIDGRIDVAFLIDTTQSMDSLIDTTLENFQGIATQLSSRFGGTGWGLATFDDYPMYPFGRPGLDKPYWLQVPVTNDTQAVIDGLDAVQIHDGQDAPESSMEALYQTISGAGYDLNCDGLYDPTLDVLPFYATPDDPFGGSAGGAGTSGLGGVGFRDGRLPIIVYATNYEMRDADDDRYNLPGGCKQDAGMSLVANAMNDAGAKVIGVSVYPATTYATDQMKELARRTNSLADLDGDGTLDPAVVEWSSDSPSFQDTIVDAVSQLMDDARWDLVWLDYDDPYGIVDSYVPQTVSDVGTGDTIQFTLTLNGVPLDGPVTMKFDLVTTGGVVLATEYLIVSNGG